MRWPRAFRGLWSRRDDWPDDPVGRLRADLARLRGRVFKLREAVRFAPPYLTETVMVAIDDLNATLAELGTDATNIGDLVTRLKANQAAPGGATEEQVAAANTALQQVHTTLSDIVSANPPPASTA